MSELEFVTRHEEMPAINGMQMSDKIGRPLTHEDIKKMRLKYGVSYKDLALELDTYIKWLIAVEQGKVEVSQWNLISIGTAILMVFMRKCMQRRLEREKAEEGNEGSDSKPDG